MQSDAQGFCYPPIAEPWLVILKSWQISLRGSPKQNCFRRAFNVPLGEANTESAELGMFLVIEVASW